MVLSEQRIKELVKAPENPILKDSRELQVDHAVHVTGENYDCVLTQIVGYENVEQFKQKKLLTKPFTRPLMKYVIDAQGRWKSAQGTTKFYKFTKDDDKVSAEFKTNILSQVWKGNSMKDFINKFLSTAIYTEFNGFLIVEQGKIEVIDGIKYETKEGKTYAVANDYQPKPYIIFKCANDIHNFSVTGDKVDWIIYKLPTVELNGVKTELFRVLDSKWDYIVQKQGDVVTIQDKKIEHKAGSTPAVPVSSINKKLGDDKIRTSPVDALIPIFDYYLNQYAEHVVSCLLHAHPIYYQVGQKCGFENTNAKCKEGELMWEEAGEHKKVICPACKGSGHNIHKDASTVIIIPALTDQGDAFDISNVAGYVHPDIEILKHQMEELHVIKRDILEAATGQIGSQQLNLKTATEVVLNLKPLEDIISEVIDVIESVEKQLTDLIGKIYYGDKYIGSEIIYGRKLNLRDENTILEEIKESKANGAPYFYIKTLFEELVYSRFAKSPSDLERNIIIIELEPFIGFNYEEIEGSANITKENKYIKQNFVDLIERLESESGMELTKIDAGKEMNARIKAMREKIKGYAVEDLKSLDPAIPATV